MTAPDAGAGSGKDLPSPPPDDVETVTLYWAVGLNEADDIRSSRGFRLGPGSAFVQGKWFAISADHALRWGRRMPPVGRPRPFLVASVSIPARLLPEFDGVARLDGIGPAYFVRHDQLPLINAAGTVLLFDPVESRGSTDESQG